MKAVWAVCFCCVYRLLFELSSRDKTGSGLQRPGHLELCWLKLQGPEKVSTMCIMSTDGAASCIRYLKILRNTEYSLEPSTEKSHKEKKKKEKYEVIVMFTSNTGTMFNIVLYSILYIFSIALSQ